MSLVIVFLGPTLSRREAAQVLDACYEPPVAQGDVMRATARNPCAIGIIDGYFERMPAVWHKEILWAMSQGIHVFGAASMGALRAAELADFGMVGVGEIYNLFRLGVLEADDEVAVTHSDQDGSFRQLSEAMVNIRATLRAAVDGGVITTKASLALEAMAKGRFYPDRSYSRLLEDAKVAGLPVAQIQALRDWLPAGRVDQKRADALALLARLAEVAILGLAPKRVQYRFEYTDAWDAARRDFDAAHGQSPADPSPRS